VDFDDSPAEAAFRAEARRWLDDHAIAKGSADDFSGDFFDPAADGDELFAKCRRWQRTMFDAGWAGVSYPRELGGRGGSTMQELIFAQEVARYGVHNGAFVVAHTMVGPAILDHGTDEQRRRFIPAMLRGDDIWCQLFSEPGSGSDLASLRTHAVRDGDEWVVDGQKVWTSSADRSDWAILLARTEPDAPRHRGITYFLLDMRTPGIDVRPLKQMTGESHFSEVFLTEVRLPAENVLGGPAARGHGWLSAMHTLANERAMIGSASTDDDMVGLLELARAAGATRDPRARQELAAAYTGTQILRYLGYRAQTALSQGVAPGPETSIIKLVFGDHLKRVSAAALAYQGATGMLAGDGGGADGGASAYFAQRFLFAPSIGIAGGTSEVQRNILGERVLGLPAEPRPAAPNAAAPPPASTGAPSGSSPLERAARSAGERDHSVAERRQDGRYAGAGVRGPDA
jgi:acyl-CoA dehydrogenase